MKKRVLLRLIPIPVLIIWFAVYLNLNHGHILSYPYNMHTVEYREMGESIGFGSNSVYYQTDDLNGFSVTVNSSEMIDSSEFCGRYHTDTEDLTELCCVYMTVNITISNNSGRDAEFRFLPLIAEGTDWWCSYSPEETGFANEGVQLSRSCGSITGINTADGEAVSVNVVFSFFPDMLTAERWAALENECIYLVLTAEPVELRVRL